MSRPNLANRLAKAAGSPSRPVFAEEGEPARETATVAAFTPEKRAAAPSRQNKTMIAGYFTPELARAVKMLAVERDVTVQALIGEGLDDVLRKYGKHPMGER